MGLKCRDDGLKVLKTMQKANDKHLDTSRPEGQLDMLASKASAIHGVVKEESIEAVCKLFRNLDRSA